VSELTPSERDAFLEKYVGTIGPGRLIKETKTGGSVGMKRSDRGMTIAALRARLRALEDLLRLERGELVD
jgi:hypothetical protein